MYPPTPWVATDWWVKQGLFAGPQSAASQKGTNTFSLPTLPFSLLFQKDRFMTQKNIIKLKPVERTMENLGEVEAVWGG